MCIRLVAMLAVLCALLAACENDTGEQRTIVTATPLELDPEDKYELGEWWSNGSQLMQLEKTGFYRLYGSQNRYHAPIQRGRWSQQSYAVIKLEPYQELPTDPTRVQISRIDGRLALNINDYAPMFSIDAPPLSPEDDLFGIWKSSRGDLVLSRNFIYMYTPTPGVAQPIVISGHRGSWSVIGNTLRFEPDTPTIQSFTLEIDKSGGEATLRGSEGIYTRSSANSA